MSVTMNKNYIKPQELRIGNWVQYKFYNPHPESPSYEYTRVKIRGIYEDSIRFSFPNHNGIHKAKEVFPIPLSEEVLLRCPQFNKVPFTDEDRFYFEWELANGLCLLSGDNDDVFLCEANNIRFQYLHQLQNIVSSLGKELEVRWT